MQVHRKLTSKSLPLIVGALAVGFTTGTFLLLSVLAGQAGPREDFADNSEFFRRGRPDVAFCVSDYTTETPDETELLSLLKDAVGDNKSGLWKDSFLEMEEVKVESPCPKGPTVSESMKDVSEYISGIQIVDQPGPYILYVHVVDAALPPGFFHSL